MQTLAKDFTIELSDNRPGALAKAFRRSRIRIVDDSATTAAHE